MKEKIIQGGIVNGVKMLVCPTWEEDFQTEIHKTGGCLRISMNYSAVDVSYWKELEEIAERYGYDLDEEAKEIINEYVKKYEQFDDMIWMSGETEIGFETFCRALAKKAGISPRQAKEYVVSNLHNLEHEEAVDALLLALQIIKSENGLEGTQWNKPTCDFLKKEFEKMLGLNDGQTHDTSDSSNAATYDSIWNFIWCPSGSLPEGFFSI